MFNVIKRTEIGQYGNSPELTGLLCDFNAWIDPTVNLQEFYTNIWNLAKAQGFGLDIWGAILGVSRNLQVAFTPNALGFSGGPSTAQPFNSAPFNSGASATQTYQLPDPDYLQLLMAKAFANICVTVIPVLNRLLTMVFGAAGTCYVQDLGNMQMAYVFGFIPSTIQYAIIAQSGVLPYPTGVLVSIQTAADVDMVLEDGVTPMLTESNLTMLVE